MVKTQHFYCRSIVSVPGWGTEIPHVEWPKKKKHTTPRDKYVTGGILYLSSLAIGDVLLSLLRLP